MFTARDALGFHVNAGIQHLTILFVAMTGLGLATPSASAQARDAALPEDLFASDAGAPTPNDAAVTWMDAQVSGVDAALRAPLDAQPLALGGDAGLVITAPVVETLAPPLAEASPALESPASTTPAAEPSAIEVTVRGGRSEAQRLQRSAEAVTVIDTRVAKQQTADLGEVLARTQGVSVRREGGLGSGTRISLNGLYDDQIRFFLDGVPLAVAGYPFGVGNVPVNLIERVEVYRGVVPIRFGADALGGALNLVTDQRDESHASASYQIGSFGMHRATLEGRYRHLPSGFVAGASGFFDRAKNDYRVDVEIPNAVGRPEPATVRRFHDGYLAYGAKLELGVVDRPWAKRLLIQGYTSGYDKELQSNMVMEVVYGAVTYGERVHGTTARYEVNLHEQLELELIASYARRSIDFLDDSSWVYNWRGERILPRRVPGEVSAKASDQTNWEDSAYGRALLKWTVAPPHVLRLSLSPAYTTRTGNERLQSDPAARDPLTAERELFTFVSGLEYELNLFQDRFANIFFVKDYFYRAHTEEPLPGGLFRRRDRSTHTAGVGDSLRYRFTSWLYGKASYEYATRLPRPDEVFGNAVLTLANLQLRPEVSHNANLGPRVELRSKLGQVVVDINAFLRESDRLIVFLTSDQFGSYQNVYKARSAGVENAAAWISPGRWVALDGSLTFQDVRNAANKGTYGDYKGDRIPNRPWLFASWGARLRFGGLPRAEDALQPFYNGRYVHEFYRGWESLGLRASKQVVDAQVSHNVGLTYLFANDAGKLSATFEVQNVSDARLFDNFGAQKPGRGYYLKLTGEI